MKLLRQNAGFGLIEITVVGAILSIMAAASVQLLVDMLKGAKTAEVRSERLSQRDSIRLIVSDPGACRNALKSAAGGQAKFAPGLELPAEEIVHTIKVGERVLAQVGGIAASQSVLAVTLEELDPNLRQTVGTSQTRYLASLGITYLANAKLYGKRQARDEYFLWVTTDTDSTNAISDHEIVDCQLQTPQPTPVTSINSTGGVGGFNEFIVFKETKPYTVPEGVTRILVEAWGAGGGGSAGNTSVRGAGGGGGAYAKQILNMTPGSVHNVTVGKGGDGGSGVGGSPFRSGQDGRETCFGNGLLCAGGGKAASYCPPATDCWNAGRGGTSTASYSISGQSGTEGAGNGVGLGSGGDSPNGGSGGRVWQSGDRDESRMDGVTPGGGGQGGRLTSSGLSSGGSGADGWVVIWW